MTFVTEAGAPSVSEEHTHRIRDALLAETGLLSGRSHAAAHAIEAAMLSDHRVSVEHADALAILTVLERWPAPLDPELIALAAALRQAPSLTHEFGRDGE